MDNDDNTFILNIPALTSISIPSTPQVGDIWFNSSNNTVVTYDSSKWVTISDNNDIDINTLDFPGPVEWEHEFPAFHKVEEMCKEYPGLAKAYENFKTIYKMVEQDWKGKKKDDPPF